MSLIRMALCCEITVRRYIIYIYIFHMIFIRVSHLIFTHISHMLFNYIYTSRASYTSREILQPLLDPSLPEALAL